MNQLIPHPIIRCLRWADAHNRQASDSSRRVIAITLLALANIGVMLLFIGWSSMTEMIKLNERTTLMVTLAGFGCTLGGIGAFMGLGYADKFPLARLNAVVIPAFLGTLVTLFIFTHVISKLMAA